MAAIVFWHVAPYGINHIPPIYPKQLGVAFFFFAAGFSLARERRSAGRALYNRLFEVYLFGIGFALFMSAVTFAVIGDLNESNYAPFVLGVNVVLDSFPANPTTWYIGTYLHAMLLWALVLRRLRVRPWMLVATCLAEVALRALLIETRGLFVAYMALSNWATVLLLGYYYGQSESEATVRESPAPWLIGSALALWVWWWVSGPWVSSLSFPFMTIAADHGAAGVLAESAAVSLVYAGLTWLAFQTTRRLPRSAIVEFLARNTLIVFLAHMPLYYLIVDPVTRWTGGGIARSLILVILCFPVLAGVSELIVRLVRPKAIREWLWALIHRPEPSEAPAVEPPPPHQGDGLPGALAP